MIDYELLEDKYDRYLDAGGEIEIDGYTVFPSELLRELGLYEEKFEAWVEVMNDLENDMSHDR
jgi:hypothetical protein